MEPLTLTFGVEFEFILAYFPKGPVPLGGNKEEKDGQAQASRKRPLPSDSPSPSSSPEKTGSPASSSSSEYTDEKYLSEQHEHHLQRSKLIPVLRAAGIPVHDAQDPSNPDEAQGYEKWAVLGDASVEPEAKHERDMAITWANGMTTTLTRAQRRVLRFTDVEITSRVLPYCLASFREIETVLSTLISRFPVLVPDSAGLHVHIGNGSKGFPLHTLQNLTTLAACFENQLNEIHPADRLDNPYCYLPRWSFEPADRDLWKMAEILDGQESVGQLVNTWQLARGSLLSNHQRCYNLANLLYTGSKKTIEFRQHEGSLDFEVVQAWVLMVGALVSVAHEVDAAVFLNLILERGYEADFDVLGLLESLGLNVLAEFYKERLHRHPRDRELKDPFIMDRGLFGGLYDTESEGESGSLEKSTSAEDTSDNGSNKSPSDRKPSNKSASDEDASEDQIGSEKSSPEIHYPARPGYDEP